MTFNIKAEGLIAWISSILTITLVVIGLITVSSGLIDWYKKHEEIQMSSYEEEVSLLWDKEKEVKQAIFYAKQKGESEDLLKKLDDKKWEIMNRINQLYEEEEIRELGDNYSPDYDKLLNY